MKLVVEYTWDDVPLQYIDEDVVVKFNDQEFMLSEFLSVEAAAHNPFVDEDIAAVVKSAGYVGFTDPNGMLFIYLAGDIDHVDDTMSFALANIYP